MPVEPRKQQDTMMQEMGGSIASCFTVGVLLLLLAVCAGGVHYAFNHINADARHAALPVRASCAGPWSTSGTPTLRSSSHAATFALTENVPLRNRLHHDRVVAPALTDTDDVVLIHGAVGGDAPARDTLPDGIDAP